MMSELKALATRVLRDIERDKVGTERSGNVPLPQSPWDISVPPESGHSEALSLADEECPAVPTLYAWDNGTFPVQPGHAAGQERDSTTSERCRYCGEPTGWPRPVEIVFGDGAALHHHCYERAEVERIRRHASNANTPEAMADEAELMIHGEPSR